MNAAAAREAVHCQVPSAGVAEIVIDRPERHNAMTMAMYARLLELVELLGRDRTIRCVLLRGAGGKSFVAGTDIEYFEDFSEGGQGLAYEAQVERVIDAVERLPVPTIAVVDGWAVGGGLALATACDFRVCSDKSRFGVPIAKTLSNTLASRNLARLVHGFGVPRVKRMLLLADFIGAAEAVACGYVHQVAEPAAVAAAAATLAERLAALSPVTQAAVKEGLRRVTLEHSFDDEDLVRSVYGSQRFRDAVAAFTAKAAVS